MDQEERYITITDEDGTDHLAEVIFTFENDGENYVLFTLVEEFEDDIDSDYSVLAYKYEEMDDGSIGNLIEIPEVLASILPTLEPCLAKLTIVPSLVFLFKPSA